MEKYKAVGWKRNLRSIPNAIREAVSRISGDNVIAVSTKKISHKEISKGTYSHLKINLKDGQILFEEQLLPSERMGRFSDRNINGWEVKRRDLPMIQKEIYLGERPAYGDWSNGSFSLWVTREVYQVDEYSPVDFKINVDLLSNENELCVFKFSIDAVFDKDDAEFDEDFLFALNILQENTGTCGADKSRKTREEYISTLTVDWEIFPPGSIEEFIIRIKGRIPKGDKKSNEVVRERVEEFKKLNPSNYVVGSGGFNSYVGAIMPNGVVVFENIRYGNALYVLYEDWEIVSQRSRIELLQGTSAAYERIPHVDGWEERFRIAVRRGKPMR